MLKAQIETLIYVAEEPVTPDQLAAALAFEGQGPSRDEVRSAVEALIAEYHDDARGL